MATMPLRTMTDKSHPDCMAVAINGCIQVLLKTGTMQLLNGMLRLKERTSSLRERVCLCTPIANCMFTPTIYKIIQDHLLPSIIVSSSFKLIFALAELEIKNLSNLTET